jgi:hypothetical protein
MRNLYVGAALDAAVCILLLATGNTALGIVFLVLLIAPLDYIRRQRR